MVVVKKKAVSKKTKSSWRKHVDVSDVDAFLEEKRLVERLGGSLDERHASDIFVIDKRVKKVKKSSAQKAQARAKTPLRSRKKELREQIRKNLTTEKCFPMLKPHSKVPDPISVRNRVRTKEERKHPLLRKKEEQRKLQGVLKAKEVLKNRDRTLEREKRKLKPKKGEYHSDIWTLEEQDVKKTAIVEQEWLTNDTKRHNLHGLGKTRKSKAVIPAKIVPAIPSVEAPHPGMSYNPSFEDHQELLRIVAEKEAKIIKEERHLNRVTKGMFGRVTADQKQESWITEMSEGLPTKDEEVERSEDEEEFKSVNPPVVNKKKTLQQKRKKKEQRVLTQSRVIAKKEKRKMSDIYKLRKLAKDIVDREKEESSVMEKRAKMREEREKGTKKLSARKYEEPDLEFKMGGDLSGNLRNLKKEGDLLRDRFYSLRKRNVLEVTARALKKKSKVKKFLKSGHKEDWKVTIPSMN